MSSHDRDKWNRKYQYTEQDTGSPAIVLSENRYLLPARGKALDLACGLGANAVELAKSGLEVHAWDISEIALEKLEHKALQEGVQIHTEQRDISLHPPEPEMFDIIVVTYFLDRKIIPHIITALRPIGLVYYQTFTRDKPGSVGPKNPDYLLERNELLVLFHKLSIVLYREEGRIGDTEQGHRNEAMLIAQKR